jgi:hypothetical protein
VISLASIEAIQRCQQTIQSIFGSQVILNRQHNASYITLEELEELKNINKKLVSSALQCWVFFVLVFFASHLFEEKIYPLSLQATDLIPSLRKIAALGGQTSRFAAMYFFMGLLTMPIALVIVSFHENVRFRLKLGIKRNRTKLRGFAAIYLMALPFFALILFMYFWLPADLSSPHLLGQKVVHLIISSRPGLLFLGSFSLMILAYILLVVAGILIYPFQSLFNLLLRK